MSVTLPYGYLAAGAPIGEVSMAPAQVVAGYPVGVIYIEDVWYPMVPGNVVNASTWDFPVLLKPVRGLDIPALFGPDRVDVSDIVLEACRELEEAGVRAISSACGFFGRYHQQIAAKMQVPVALSSLVQIPWISSLMPGRRIAVLTADSSSLAPELLASCGVTDTSRLVIGGLQDAPQFSAILEGRGSFDNEGVRDEVVALARELCADPAVGAVLLECSDLPPYAAAIQAAVSLPVFDFTTLVRWLRNAVTQRPYAGWV
ncbi:aspartate/glutamate racemase family protein [Raineyella sp. W15-4]|uniref:aspartate/glutamate racemase family protein n=1 Tax=Raineyella sp. W15-4 TaxID=3081651 RepID=UPI0029531F88|nr:aspartate/glutamate racemase family protein [Raineyella sp. W15-4]WOQ15746.1 aspartate/glutamate racemase family protein [Raineyella sp. W15-4]